MDQFFLLLFLTHDDFLGILEVVLHGVGEVIAVAEVEVGAEVDGIEHLDISGFIAMGHPDIVVRDVDQLRVHDGVNGMLT